MGKKMSHYDRAEEVTYKKHAAPGHLHFNLICVNLSLPTVVSQVVLCGMATGTIVLIRITSCKTAFV